MSSDHQYSVSDGIISYFSSPSDSFHAQPWNTLAQGVNLGELVSTTMAEPRSESLSLPLSKEGCLVAGTSTIPYSVESTSSHSDAGDHEQSGIIHIPSSHRNFSGRYSFMSKPVYPITFLGQTSDSEVHGMCSGSRLISAEGRNSSRWPDGSVHPELKSFGGFSEFGSMQGPSEVGSSSQRVRFRWNSASSLDFGWDRESPDRAEIIFDENSKFSGTLSEDLKCGLCERWLFQKSPWSSHRMIRSSDMPVAGVLSCSHVYHAECLEQTTPKAQKHDPPCPLCAGVSKSSPTSNFEQAVSVSDLQMISTPVNKFPRFNLTTDDGGPSSSGIRNYAESDYIADVSGRKWAMQMLPRSNKSFLSRTRLRKHFLSKGKPVKELPAVELGLRGAGSPLQAYPGNRSIDHFPIGCSRRGHYLKKW